MFEWKVWIQIKKVRRKGHLAFLSPRKPTEGIYIASTYTCAFCAIYRGFVCVFWIPTLQIYYLQVGCFWREKSRRIWTAGNIFGFLSLDDAKNNHLAHLCEV